MIAGIGVVSLVGFVACTEGPNSVDSSSFAAAAAEGMAVQPAWTVLGPPA